MLEHEEPVAEGLCGIFMSRKTNEVDYADSIYELARMIQLDNDEIVKEWWKSGDTIPFTFEGREYEFQPDFHVVHTDGRHIVEEVASAELYGEPFTQAQARAAQHYYNQFRVDFQFVTENTIGLDFLRQLDFDSLATTHLALTRPEIIQRLKASVKFVPKTPIYVPRRFKRLLAETDDFNP